MPVSAYNDFVLIINRFIVYIEDNLSIAINFSGKLFWSVFQP